MLKVPYPLAYAGPIARRIGAAGTTALAAWRPAQRRNGDAGYAILLHVDAAEQCEVTTLSFGLQLVLQETQCPSTSSIVLPNPATLIAPH